MAVNPDFKDLFVAFNDAEVRFLVVGAYAQNRSIAASHRGDEAAR
ncbi:MAG: hypothetical protein ACYSX0_05260 [Planctomycetota bacterium]|jgi:hypothetical protein